MAPLYELRAKTLGDLKRMARDLGVSEDALDTCDGQPDPKKAVLQEISKKKAASDDSLKPPIASLLTVTNRDKQYIALAVEQGKAQTVLEDGNLEHVVAYNVKVEDMEKPGVVETLNYLEDQKQLGDQDGFRVTPLIIVKGARYPDNITLGEIRNLAIRQSQGEYVVVWDDDDLYHCRRVAVQVEKARLTGASTFNSVVVHETDARARQTGKARRSYLQHSRPDMGWEMTLCCSKSILGTPEFSYAHLNAGEDTPLLEKLYREGKITLIPHGVNDDKMYIYMRQGTPTATCDENGWYDLRQIRYDFNDVLKFALDMQPHLPAEWYKVVFEGLPVNESQNRESKELTQLTPSQFVKVIDVAPEHDAGRVRARISKPVPGWISLRMADGSGEFVIKANSKEKPEKICLSKAVLGPFLSEGSTRFPRPPPFGHLSVRRGTIVGEQDEPANLHGVSLSWSQWKPKYWKYGVIKLLMDDWRVNLIRAPVAVEKKDGYLELEAVNVERIDDVVQACLALGVYVIVDWHAEDDYEQEAVEFFKSMATKYGRFPHVIFEAWHQPSRLHQWSRIKAYHKNVTHAIRDVGARNVVVVTGPEYSSITDEMLNDDDFMKFMDTDGAIAFGMQAYMTNENEKKWRMTQAKSALGQKKAFMVTQWGVGDPNAGTQKRVEWLSEEKQATAEWVNFLKDNKICHTVWHVSNEPELHAFLTDGASGEVDDEGQQWKEDAHLTQVGKYVRNMHRAYEPTKDEDRDWIKCCGLPQVLVGDEWQQMEGETHSIKDKFHCVTVEDMKKACMSAPDCVGFAYRPEQYKRGKKLDQAWFPKIAGTFIPGIATYQVHELGQKWEWYYKAVAKPAQDKKAKMVTFKNHHGKYVSAKSDLTVKADMQHAEALETIIIETIEGSARVALRTCHGKYLVALPEEQGFGLRADSPKIRPWNKFTIETAGSAEVAQIFPAAVALKTYHGKYVCAEKDGTLKADRDTIDQWERFILDEAKETGWMLSSKMNCYDNNGGRNVDFKGQNDIPVIATVDAAKKTCLANDYAGFTFCPDGIPGRHKRPKQVWYLKEITDTTKFKNCDDKMFDHTKCDVHVRSDKLPMGVSALPESRPGTVRIKDSHTFGSVVLWGEAGEWTGVYMPNGDPVIIVGAEKDSYEVVWQGRRGTVKKHHIQSH